MAILAGARPSQARGARAISRVASSPKHLSFAASSQTVAHAGGTVSACQPPVVVIAPMSKFHPPFTLTSAHRCMRTQLRSVQGLMQASASAVTPAARKSRGASPPPPAMAKNPKTGASSNDCGRTSIAQAITEPAAVSQGHATRAVRARAARAAAATSREAVTPSVITAAVYGSSAG
ncbi:MAG TPA: hypothetical protein VKU41_06150 [Polyangiaceae bacterium]|nr:hypothetical protein [Polyangiaceae bacterium]